MSSYRQLKLSIWVQVASGMPFYDDCYDGYYYDDNWHNWIRVTEPDQLCIIREWYREYLQNLAYTTGLFQFMGIYLEGIHLCVLYNGFMTPFVYELIQQPAPCTYAPMLYLYGGYYNVYAEQEGFTCDENETRSQTIPQAPRAAIIQKPHSRHKKTTK